MFRSPPAEFLKLDTRPVSTLPGRAASLEAQQAVSSIWEDTTSCFFMCRGPQTMSRGSILASRCSNVRGLRIVQYKYKKYTGA